MKLPYFDALLEQFDAKNVEMEEAFGLNVHWGYWEDPSKADGSTSDFREASRAMTLKVCAQGRLRDGMKILDVGCGFGGTIHELNSAWRNVELTGLNIDPRQLARARKLVTARPGNRVTFVEGDACALPFADASFDVVFAVECIFHFPSRAKFFREARRVLKPGGRLVVSDYSPKGATFPLLLLQAIPLVKSLEKIYGKSSSMVTETGYRKLGRRAGFEAAQVTDITARTVPTYEILDRIARTYPSPRISQKAQLRGNAFLRGATRRGWLRYLVMDFA